MQYGTFCEVSKENILKRISPFEIMRFYVSWFEVGKSIRTPFKNEGHPSFWSAADSRGNIFFKDFGRGYHGDCFQLVMLLFNIPFYEALDKINIDMQLGLGPQSELNPHSGDKKWQIDLLNRPQVVATETKPINITFRERPWTNLDTHFWISHGTHPEIKSRLAIVAISDFWLGNAWVKADKLAYAWQTANGRVKIYQPFNKYDMKWRSNTNNQALQGEHLLPEKGPLLLFQSSLKDIGAVLSRYGIPCIAPNGEHGIIPMDKRVDFEKRFDRIGVMYDTDEEGIKAAQKVCDESDYEMFVLPTIKNTKDPSDFMANGLVKTLDNFITNVVINK